MAQSEFSLCKIVEFVTDFLFHERIAQIGLTDTMSASYSRYQELQSSGYDAEAEMICLL